MSTLPINTTKHSANPLQSAKVRFAEAPHTCWSVKDLYENREAILYSAQAQNRQNASSFFTCNQCVFGAQNEEKGPQSDGDGDEDDDDTSTQVSTAGDAQRQKAAKRRSASKKKRKDKEAQQNQNLLDDETLLQQLASSVDPHCRHCHKDVIYFKNRKVIEQMAELRKRKKKDEWWEVQHEEFNQRFENGDLPTYQNSYYYKKKVNQLKKENEELKKLKSQESERWQMRKAHDFKDEFDALHLSHKSLVILKQKNEDSQKFSVLQTKTHHKIAEKLRRGNISGIKSLAGRTADTADNLAASLSPKRIHKKQGINLLSQSLEDDGGGDESTTILKTKIIQSQVTEDMANVFKKAVYDEKRNAFAAEMRASESEPPQQVPTEQKNIFGSKSKQMDSYVYRREYEYVLQSKRLSGKEVHERDYYQNLNSAISAAGVKGEFSIEEMIFDQEEGVLLPEFEQLLSGHSKHVWVHQRDYLAQKLRELVELRVQDRIRSLNARGFDIQYRERALSDYMQFLESIQERYITKKEPFVTPFKDPRYQQQYLKDQQEIAQKLNSNKLQREELNAQFQKDKQAVLVIPQKDIQNFKKIEDKYLASLDFGDSDESENEENKKDFQTHTIKNDLSKKELQLKQRHNSALNGAPYKEQRIDYQQHQSDDSEIQKSLDIKSDDGVGYGNDDRKDILNNTQILQKPKHVTFREPLYSDRRKNSPPSRKEFVHDANLRRKGEQAVEKLKQLYKGKYPVK